MHIGHVSQLRPVTMLNDCTFDICSEFLYLGMSSKMPQCMVPEKLVEHGLESANLDLCSFTKSAMLTRCAC